MILCLGLAHSCFIPLAVDKPLHPETLEEPGNPRNVPSANLLIIPPTGSQSLTVAHDIMRDVAAWKGSLKTRCCAVRAVNQRVTVVE